MFIDHSKFLAFRAITQTKVEYFKANSDMLNDMVKSKMDKNQDTKMFNKKTSDLIKLLNLTTNETNSKLEDYIRIRNTLITIFYLNLLKAGGYFKDLGSPIKENYQYSEFSQTEILVGSIIEKLLLVVKFNTHEVGQMESLDIYPSGCQVLSNIFAEIKFLYFLSLVLQHGKPA